MFLLDSSRLLSAVSAIACLALTSVAKAEVASVYGGSDGLCGSRTANGEHMNCSAMTAAHRHFAIWHASKGLSSWLRGRTDQ
jgi:rare lipoprotein A (peptidoglycan hydrolase)